MTRALARSYLFVPGHRADRFDKACATGAGMVIIDLEDAVAPAEKTAARSQVANWLDETRPVAVRVNAGDSEWFSDDCALCAHPAVQAVILPKAESRDALHRLRASAPQTALLPLIETARGMAQAQTIAGTEGVQRLVFGNLDFQLDLGIEGDGEELLHFRSQLVLASRLAEVAAPVDGVCTVLDDPQVLREATLRARRLGFGAKLCIHPKQVEIVNAAFAPTATELEWARRVVAAADASQGAAVALDGKMIDTPVILKARALLAAD